jgi:hypothetical protein
MTSDDVAIVRKHHNMTIVKHLEGQLREERLPKLNPPKLPFAPETEESTGRYSSREPYSMCMIRERVGQKFAESQVLEIARNRLGPQVVVPRTLMS